MRRTPLPLALLIPLAFPLPALATDIQAASAVTAVTVYPDAARVTRTASVDLPAGDSVVVFPDLPAAAPPDGLQVAGESATALTVVSVEARKAFLDRPAPEAEAALAAALEKLKEERRAVDDRKAALADQLDFIRSIAKAALPEAKEGLLTGKPADWPAAWTAIGQGSDKTLAAIHAQDVEARALDRKIAQAAKELARVRTGASERLAVRVHVHAASAATARLAVTYQVPGASWSPVYDARLDPEAARLALTLRAQVRQRTGEDWEDAVLTLSTARPTAGAAMAEPTPWFIGQAPVARSLMKSGGLITSDELEGMPQTPAAFAPAEERVAETAASEFSLAYRVAGPQTVPADGEPHRFTADTRDLPVRLAVRARPRAEERAYLYALLTNDGAPLPGGSVQLFRGGALVGRAALADTPTGDERRLPFGADDRVRVTRRVDRDLAGKKGLFGKRHRVERRDVIEVENFHGRPVEITVYDRLPVPRQEQIEVKYLDDWATPPTDTDWEGRKGVLAWTRPYAPKERGEIRFGYTVSYPEGWTVPGF